ncbi:MAG: DNA sulfur modification protein DndD, partial [Planctomycetaceae bacterium]|nr:DNA sulfur modification protein DndD [Planctomycetaceae bacterium]
EREAEVILHFQDDDGGAFSIRRVWVYDSRGRFRQEEPPYVETEHGSLTPEQYDDFVKNRIPSEVVKFFMFDGEKIHAIAEDELGTAVVKGIDLLLGFHVLDALVNDMDELQKRYRSRAKEQNRQEEELTDLRSSETKLSNQIGELEEEQVEVEERVVELKDKSRALVEELNELLGGHGKSPKDLQSELDRANDSIRDLKDQITGVVDRSIIPAMPTALLQRLDEQLRGEEERAQWEEGKRKVEPQRNRLIEKLLGIDAPQPVPPFVNDHIQFLRKRIRDEWDDLFNPPPVGIATTVVHGYLSNQERAQVQNKCRQVMQSASVNLRGLFEQLDSAERQARNLREQLEHIGDGERANAIIEEKSGIDRELGETEQKWESLKRNIQALRTDLKEVKRQIENKESELRKSGQSGDRANFVRKVKRAVQLYQDALRPRKRDSVARHLTEMYRHLARKEDVVEQIRLDEKTYRPDLLDRNGNTMPLHSLSAGEREIYALSLLWALGKTSRRDLPVVIDTPLARLDSEHRANIVKRYLPQAGPQVIVLSTDTEIDRQYFGLIDDYMATTLRLDFDPATERTTVQEGYFSFD